MTLPASIPASADQQRIAPVHGNHVHSGNLRLFGLLRDIRTDADHVRRQLPALEAAARVEDARARSVALRSAMTRLRQLLDDDGAAIEGRLVEARTMLDADEALYDWGGDSVTEVENDWHDFLALVPPGSSAAEVEQAAVLRLTSDGPAALDELSYVVGLLTIPFRLNEQLEGVRIGGSLDFHAAFEDEVPKPADRMRILSWMASQPSAIGGVVDLAEGRIYRASNKPGRRLASLLALIALAVVGGFMFCLALANLGTSFGLTQWPISAGRLQEFLGAYVILALGAVSHVLIDAIKQARSASGSSRFLALGDWLLWIHVRELSIGVAVVSLWVGLTGLAVVENPISAITAFFAGYSIDSVVDLFATRFDRFASGRLSELEKGLSG